MRRFRRIPRIILCLALILSLGAFYPILQLLSLTQYGDPYNSGVVSCTAGEEVQEALVRMGRTLTAALGTGNVTSFLCYGSLWAYLRRGRLFPWDRTLRLCALAPAFDDPDTLAALTSTLNAAHLAFTYDRTSGVYTVREEKYGGQVSSLKEPIPEVFLFVWELNHALRVNGQHENVFRRVGWKHKVLPPGSEALEEFPERLIQLPLRSVTFSGIKVEIPHEDAEIQKYHYKDDWWTEVRPPGC